MDVFWFRIPKSPAEEGGLRGNVARSRLLVMIDRRDYWQCAFLILKGADEQYQSKGIDAIRAEVAAAAPPELDLAELDEISDLHLLTVKLDRLTEWFRPGLLAIGDAAHAMSPIGGVGINLAIQDAVAAANILAAPLRRGALTDRDLARVEKRRRFPTWATQKMQTTVQNRVIDPLLSSGRTPAVPGLVKLAQRWTWLQRIPARLIGMGFRPEHVSRTLL